MAGYSGTPLAKKLGIGEAHRVALVGAPEGFAALLEPLPARVEILRSGKGPADVVVFFTKRLSELSDRFASLRDRIPPEGGLWVAWPKKSSGVATDLTENVIRGVGLAEKLVDNKVCAIDETWSGLRFVWRKADRPR